jgi:hypothetical protein
MFLFSGFAAELGATLGQRHDRKKHDPAAGRTTRWTLLLCAGVAAVGSFLYYLPILHLHLDFEFPFLTFVILCLYSLIGYVWGKLFWCTGGAGVAVGLIAAIVSAVPKAFLFGGFLIGGTVAAAFVVAEPLRNFDRTIYSHLNSLLDWFATLGGAVKPGETTRTAVEEEPKGWSFGLGLRLLLVTAGCGYLGMMIGVSSGSVNFVDEYRYLETLWVITCTAAAAGALAVALSRSTGVASFLAWLVGGAALSVGTFALATALGHVWFRSPVVVASALVVAGGLVGFLAGMRHDRPQTGVMVGLALSGAAIVAGLLFAHPDIGALIGIPIGLLGGMLLWTGVSRKARWVARGLATAVLGVAVVLALSFRNTLGTAVTGFQHPRGIQTAGYTERYNGSYGGRRSRLAVSLDGDRLLTLDNSGVHLWDVRSRKYLRTSAQNEQEVRAIGFQNNTPLVLVQNSNNQTWTIWNVETGEPVVEVKRQSTSYPYAGVVAVSETGTFAILEHAQNPKEGEEYVVHFVEPASKASTPYKLPSKKRNYTAMAMSPDNRSILLGTEDGVLYRGALNPSGSVISVENETKQLAQRVTRIEYSPSGAWAYALSANPGLSGVLVWRVDGWREFTNLQTGSAPPTCAAFSLDDSELLVGVDRGKVQRWNLTDKQLDDTYAVQQSIIMDRKGGTGELAYLPPDGTSAVSLGLFDNRLLMWSVRQGGKAPSRTTRPAVDGGPP